MQISRLGQTILGCPYLGMGQAIFASCRRQASTHTRPSLAKAARTLAGCSAGLSSHSARRLKTQNILVILRRNRNYHEIYIRRFFLYFNQTYKTNSSSILTLTGTYLSYPNGNLSNKFIIFYDQLHDCLYSTSCIELTSIKKTSVIREALSIIGAQLFAIIPCSSTTLLNTRISWNTFQMGKNSQKMALTWNKKLSS